VYLIKVSMQIHIRIQAFREDRSMLPCVAKGVM
jgi:hypothetical protein